MPLGVLVFFFFWATTEHLIVMLDAKLDETGSPVVDL
jgi:hypothetical protein